MSCPICHVCGSATEAIQTDLPFKRDRRSIVVIRDLPVFQCSRCQEYLLEDPVMARVEQILAAVDRDTELEIVRFAA